MKLNARLFSFLSILLLSTSVAQENIWQGRSGTLAEPTEDYQEGLFPYGTSYYEFSENGTGVHYFGTDTGSREIEFQYQVVDEHKLLITDKELVRLVWGQSIYYPYPPYYSNFYYQVADIWGQDVADAIEACESYASQWWGKTGIESEEWDVITDEDGVATLLLTQNRVDILEVSERVANECSDWDLGTSIIARRTLPVVTRNYQYSETQNSLFHELTESDIPGAWAIPIWYLIPKGENSNGSSFEYPAGFQDKIVFDQNNAIAQHSGYTFTWSLDNGVLTLERDNERLEYTASQRRSNYFQVTVKHYEDNQLTNLFNSQMAKFTFHSSEHSIDLQNAVLKDYPMVWGSTTRTRNKEKYNNDLPTCDNLFFLAFLSIDRVITSSCYNTFHEVLQEEVEYYPFLNPHPNMHLEIDDESEELGVVRSSSARFERRVWQIVELLDDQDLLVLQHYTIRTDDNSDGELEPSEEYIASQPDLVIYRRMDLSNNEEAWANTDSDDDGLSNPREQELGTDMLNADSDGDGISDGDEVANGTNPLRNNNIVFVPFDYDGDGKADVGVRRPSTSLQYILNSSNDEIQRVTFGLQAGDIPVSGDFDGDGIADIGVRRPSNFTWYILNSSDDEIQRIVFGRDSDDIPVPADYDGDGITDVAVRRASSQMWYILNSSDGEIQRINFGLQETDIPVPADYDGDGKADVAVRLASEQMWYILNSSDNNIQRIQFGLQEADIPVPADFDGDGKADVAVRRASNQMWYILNSSDAEIQRIKFGLQEGDVPIVADYDGDGKADVAVRRPSTQLQYILRSSDDQIERIHFGRQSGDIALAAPVSIKMQMLVDSASQEAGSSAPESAQRVLLTSEQ